MLFVLTVQQHSSFLVNTPWIIFVWWWWWWWWWFMKRRCIKCTYLYLYLSSSGIYVYVCFCCRTMKVTRGGRNCSVITNSWLSVLTSPSITTNTITPTFSLCPPCCCHVTHSESRMLPWRVTRCTATSQTSSTTRDIWWRFHCSWLMWVAFVHRLAPTLQLTNNSSVVPFCAP